MTRLRIWVSYGQFYATDGGFDTPLLGDAFYGQTNGLCGARTGRSLFFITGLHTGWVPVEVQILDAPPPLEPEWEDAVEVSMQLTGTELIVQGWGADGHTIAVPGPGPYRVRYCAAGMDAGRDQDHTVGDEPAPDRYRIQCWPATDIAPDTILRTTSENAAYWHGAVGAIAAPADPAVIRTPTPTPMMARITTATAASVTAGSEPVWLPTPPSWVELLTLMVHGPDPEPAVRGTIRTEQGLVRIWRDGDRYRIEDPGGTVLLIVDDRTRWQFDGDHPLPLAMPRRAFGDGGTALFSRRRPESFLGDDFTRPAGPIGTAWFLGRLAWTVELASPPRKPHPMQLVVDAETGLILQRRIDGSGIAEEWVEFVAGDPLDPEMVTWTGPTRSAADDVDDSNDIDAARRLEWFARHVSAEPIRVELDLEVVVHDIDEATGAFEATLGAAGIGMLARRLRSDEPWDLPWSQVQSRWRTERWDWALTVLYDRPTGRSVTALQQQLGDR